MFIETLKKRKEKKRKNKSCDGVEESEDEGKKREHGAGPVISTVKRKWRGRVGCLLRRQ